MEINELKSLAENTFDDLMNNFWDEAFDIAYENINNESEKQIFYNLLLDMIKKY